MRDSGTKADARPASVGRAPKPPDRDTLGSAQEKERLGEQRGSALDRMGGEEDRRGHPRRDLGRPGARHEILVYKVYRDGVEGLDLGGSAAQSVILMLLVIALPVLQFRPFQREPLTPS